MNIYGAWGACQIGLTKQANFTAGVASRIRLVNTGALPVLFVCRATQGLRNLQGDENVVATANSRFWRAQNLYPILVESAKDAYLSLYGDSANGVLHYTNCSYLGAY